MTKAVPAINRVVILRHCSGLRMAFEKGKRASAADEERRGWRPAEEERRPGKRYSDTDQTTPDRTRRALRFPNSKGNEKTEKIEDEIKAESKK